MKHDVLHAIAHNFADSLASGNCFVIGLCHVDIFGEARRSRDGFMTVNFLSGEVSGGKPSAELTRALMLFKAEFPGFCAKHGASVSDFREVTVRYMPTLFEKSILDNCFSVTIEDAAGRRSSIDYIGVPGRRLKGLDDRGRIRRKPG